MKPFVTAVDNRSQQPSRFFSPKLSAKKGQSEYFYWTTDKENPGVQGIP